MSELLDISSIEEDPSTQPRLAMNMDVVADYAEAMEAGEGFPPLIVFKIDGQYVLIDGFHRIAAARKAGLKEIHCDVHTGTLRDAILYSCGTNSSHGLRRTKEDKRRAVLRLLSDLNGGSGQAARLPQSVMSLILSWINAGVVPGNVDSENPPKVHGTRKYMTKHGTAEYHEYCPDRSGTGPCGTRRNQAALEYPLDTK